MVHGYIIYGYLLKCVSPALTYSGQHRAPRGNCKVHLLASQLTECSLTSPVRHCCGHIGDRQKPGSGRIPTISDRLQGFLGARNHRQFCTPPRQTS